MNHAVKVFKIFASMPNHRARKRRPRFVRDFDRTGNEKLVVRIHGQTSNVQPAFATGLRVKLRRSRRYGVAGAQRPTFKLPAQGSAI
jgi:hypothetical protein